MLGFAGGLFLSVLVFAAYDILSRRFRSPHDVEKILDVPVLVTLAGRQGDNAFLAEDVRVLLEKNDLKNVAVAGFVAGDGAASVAHDLGQKLGDAVIEAGSLRDDPSCVQRLARADSVLLVLSYSAAKRADIAWAVEQMKVAGTPILGAVFRPKAVSAAKRA